MTRGTPRIQAVDYALMYVDYSSAAQMTWWNLRIKTCARREANMPLISLKGCTNGFGPKVVNFNKVRHFVTIRSRH